MSPIDVPKVPLAALDRIAWSVERVGFRHWRWTVTVHPPGAITSWLHKECGHEPSRRRAEARALDAATAWALQGSVWKP